MRNLIKFFLPAIFCIGVSMVSKGSVNQSGNDENYIYFVLDNSGSMLKNDPNFTIKEVVRKMVDSLDRKFNVGIVLFSEDVNVILMLSKNDESLKASIDQILQKITYKGQYTNIPEAMERAIYDLNQIKDKKASKSIVLLTDGYVDLRDKNSTQSKREWLVSSLAKGAKDAEIKIFGIAFTDKADFELIQEITHTTDGEYFRVLNASEIPSVFSTIKNKLDRVILEQTTLPVKEQPTQVILQKQSDLDTNWLNIIIAGLSLIILAVLIYSVLLILRKRKVQSTGGEINEFKSTQKMVIPPAIILDLDKSTNVNEYSITQESTGFGRSPDNDIIIADDQSVTRYNHAQIIFKDNQFYLKDLSSNYTKLNGQKLKKRILTEINDGDIISIVEKRFRFMIPNDGSKTIVNIMESENEDINSKTVIMPASPNEEDQNEHINSHPETTGTYKSEPPVQDATNYVPKCFNHPEVDAVKSCEKCSNQVCAECYSIVNGSVICNHCQSSL